MDKILLKEDFISFLCVFWEYLWAFIAIFAKNIALRIALR